MGGIFDWEFNVEAGKRRKEGRAGRGNAGRNRNVADLSWSDTGVALQPPSHPNW